MDVEEVLDGLTNDMVLRRLRGFLVGKGLPDGRYLFTNTELAEQDNGQHKGKLELALPRSSVEGLNVE